MRVDCNESPRFGSLYDLIEFQPVIYWRVTVNSCLFVIKFIYSNCL